MGIAPAALTTNDIKIPIGLLRQLFGRQPFLQQTDGCNICEIDSRGRMFAGFCLFRAIAGDVMLAQKIALETDEWSNASPISERASDCRPLSAASDLCPPPRSATQPFFLRPCRDFRNDSPRVLPVIFLKGAAMGLTIKVADLVL